VYLDTLGMGSLCANLDGYCTRHKVRWWWYGQDVVGAEAYLKLKSKDNLLSAKQRYRQRNPHIARPQLQYASGVLAALYSQKSWDLDSVQRDRPIRLLDAIAVLGRKALHAGPAIHACPQQIRSCEYA
jgi:hypothetical protein